MTSVASPTKDLYSLYSASETLSLKSISSLERHASQYQADIERFASPALLKQRAAIDERKEQEQATLAVCAKLERAIGRRLSLQDAVFTKKSKPSAVVAPSTGKLAGPLARDTAPTTLVTSASGKRA